MINHLKKDFGGYYLASPQIGSTYNGGKSSFFGTISRCYIIDGYASVYNIYYGIRPVVCLPSDVLLTKDHQSGIWKINK